MLHVFLSKILPLNFSQRVPNQDKLDHHGVSLEWTNAILRANTIFYMTYNYRPAHFLNKGVPNFEVIYRDVYSRTIFFKPLRKKPLFVHYFHFYHFWDNVSETLIMTNINLQRDLPKANKFSPELYQKGHWDPFNHLVKGYKQQNKYDEVLKNNLI